jgi:hypothetical protein
MADPKISLGGLINKIGNLQDDESKIANLYVE